LKLENNTFTNGGPWFEKLVKPWLKTNNLCQIRTEFSDVLLFARAL